LPILSAWCENEGSREGLDLTWIQLAYGVFLLLSDMRWMVKLVVCSAGSKRCIARLGNSEARAKVAAPASNTAD
jgi:hypothetical protein